MRKCTGGVALKKWLKTVLIVLLAIIVIAGSYVAYVFIDYHRIGSSALPVNGKTGQTLAVGEEFTLMDWNIGFGAYTADYDFFMDGGKQS